VAIPGIKFKCGESPKINEISFVTSNAGNRPHVLVASTSLLLSGKTYGNSLEEIHDVSKRTLHI
jgi:hypothetical protein